MYEEGKAVFRAGWWLVAIRIVSAGISCLSNPCLHGICLDDINSTYSCYCVDGYTGVQCQTNWDECWSNPCQNGGTCIDGVASYNCSCPDGFIGDNCETNYNECESNPCSNNGTCIDMTNGYVCSCIPGFSGEHCEVDIAVCNSTEEVRCYNGGECIEGPGFKFYCKCLPGWAGPKCEDQIDECQSNPCQNSGICIDVHADYMCACPFGYTGKSCEVQIEFCDENSCSNNALCVVEDSVRVCYCVPDFHGERCELQYDECLLGPRCLNGGTCIDGVDNFTCTCPPRLAGTLCECLILDNNTLDCEYVSPTPFSQTTKSVLTTLINEETTTDMTTAYSVIYTKNIPKTSTTEIEQPITTISTTTTEEITELTTEATPSTKEYIYVSASTEVINTFKETSEIYDMSTIPMGTDDSKAETTSQCTYCKETTSTTMPTSVDETTTSAENSSSSTTFLTTTTSSLLTTKETTEISLLTTESTITTETRTTSDDMITEATTTLKSDTTTEKMFTDTPTEQPVTYLPLPIPLTTEATESTSGIIITTAQSECTDTLCSNHGTCVNSPHGIQCHCIFNYAGKFCEERISIASAAFGGHSYIAHKLRNTTSVVIAFNAKTLITDGQIMHIDIAKDVYTQLYLNAGLLKFKFSCGYQTMLLSELKTFVNKGYPMRIETRLDLYIKEQHCNATLRLNDTVAMSGGQVANITSLDYNATLYLGNAPNKKDSETKPFIGCITDLEVNGEMREIFGDAVVAGDVTECISLSCLSSPCFNGGSCKDTNGGYTCSCTNGWFGEQCNRSVCEHNPCQAGGSCVRHPGSGFLCLCPYGKHGIFCEYNVEITRPSLSPISPGISSYLVYPLSPSAVNSDRFDLRLRLQTTDMDQIALLAFVGQHGHHDSKSQHLALTFVKGYIMLTWNMGSGARRVFTSRALSYRRGGHTVRVWRRGRAAGLSVDARLNASGNAPAHKDKMTLLPYLYIGGHPSEGFHELPHDLPLHSGWRGCIWEVGGQAAGGRVVGGRGAGQCGVAQCTAKSCNAPRGVCIHSPATYGCICNEGWFGATCSTDRNPCDRTFTKCMGQCIVTADDNAHCDCPYGKTGINCDEDLIPTDVLFTGVRSYISLHPRSINSVSLSLEAEMKPTRERGLLVFIHTPHFYTVLSLQGGLLEYRWTDRLSGLTSLVRSGVVLSMSQWHSVKAGRYGSRLYVWVDGAISTEAMLAHAYPHTAANASILLGGAKDLSTLPFDAMSGPPEFYTGCLRNFHLNNILLTLEQQNIQEGQNVEDCDGTACGGETCGGAACVVERGRARCACAGARCRRHARCTRDTCAAPRGVCRAHLCVCAAGYAGIDCERQINITIPQFEGDSFLSLYRKPARPASEQRLSTSTTPGYITFNFTTAQTNGLLLWMTMDLDYIGIGLEKGYLKIVWNFHNFTNHSAKYEMHPKPRVLSRLMPNAGLLADAEWHTLVLRVDKLNISLIVDEVPYIEELGLNIQEDYDDVDVYVEGQNVEDCDGTACGGETCGGAACVVERGRARCACAGARCRRHARCTRDTCAAPRGVCRAHLCVCAAGYAGIDCERQINITIPQFEGDSFLSLYRKPARPASEQRLSTSTTPGYITFNFTTAQTNGLLLWMTMDLDYIGIGLEKGYLKIVWNFHNFTNHSAKYEMHPKPRVLSRLMPNAGLLADAEWHTLVLRVDKLNISLIVDEVPYIEELGLNIQEDYDDVDVYVEGQNVEDCDGTACGGETCGGAACVVERGRARCACAGARCRRHARCTRDTCAAPRGVCRAHLCVCAAGYAGIDCERQINITIPQFEGDSFLSLYRKPARPASEQRLSTSTTPGYITFNFTTAQTNGLLLWMTMDLDYIGIGLEKGYLKIVWNFHNFTNHSAKYEMHPKPRVLSRLMPNAGLLADAEWHTLVLRVDKLNISLIVDEVPYIEELGLNIQEDYDDVDVYVGGITEDNVSTVRKLFPLNFKGCIDHISTKEKTYIANYTEFYSENVMSCQLFPPT